MLIRAYTFLLILTVLILSAHLGLSQCQTSDRDALMSLYSATNGANWKSNTNWGIGDCSTWHGITFSASSQLVTEINLSSNNLVGTLPSDFFHNLNTSALVTVHLSSNLISGNVSEAHIHLAAWTVVGNVLLNLDEAFMCP